MNKYIMAAGVSLMMLGGLAQAETITKTFETPQINKLTVTPGFECSDSCGV